jgi:methionine transaminase
MIIDSKLPDVGTTIFTVMSKMAADCGAINLSQGFPDFEPHPELIERVNYYMRKGFNQYAPMQGVPELRRRIAEKTWQLYGARVDPETEITVTSGATESVFTAITAVVRPGDEVIVLEPAYDAYVPAVRLNQGIAVHIPLTFPDYRIDWQHVRQKLTGRTRLIILNSPHNPTGTVLGEEDLQALRDLAAHGDFMILSDEVYEHIIFDGRRHESMLRYPDLAERSFVVSSFGKTYHTTGWKVGYCIAPQPLSIEFRKVRQFVTFATNTPIQMAYADFLEREALYTTLSDFYQRKRDLFVQRLAGGRLKPLPCAGTYFVMLDYSAVSDRPDHEMAQEMTRRYGVAAIPPSCFYRNGSAHKVLRFCFAKKDETLINAAEILCRI